MELKVAIRNTIFFLTSIFLLGIILSLSTKVEAYRGPIIELDANSPNLVVELEDIDPGDKISRQFTVTHDFSPNEDGEDPSVNFKLEVVNFTQRREGDGIEFIDDSELPLNLRMSEWIELEPSSFNLDTHGTSQDIVFTINVPRNATAGGKYAAILVKPTLAETGESIGPTGAASGINLRLSVPIFLTINGDLDLDLAVSDFHVERIDGRETNLFWGPPIKAVVTFENNGNVHLAPRGVMHFHTGDLQDALRDSLLSLQLNEDLLYVLPGSSRTFEFMWNPESFISLEPSQEPVDESDLNDNELTYSRKYDFSNFDNILFGNYIATLQFAADNDSDFLEEIAGTEQVSFWIIPVPLVIGTVVVILLIVVFIAFKITRRNKKKKNKVQTQVNQQIQNPPRQHPIQQQQPINNNQNVTSIQSS